MKSFDLKTILIFLSSLAVILLIFAYFAVFGPLTGSYQVSGSGTATNTTNIISLTTPSSTATGTPFENVPSEVGSSTATTFTSSFPKSPLTWPEGQSKISITGASLEDTQLSFTLAVQTGAAPECVPLNLRLVADEAGDLDPPTPASFTFPDTGNCNGTPNQTYTNQTATFTVDPTMLPLLFTTGGASNIFFEIATTTTDGLEVDFPGTSG
jgi:hypothetical protein